MRTIQVHTYVKHRVTNAIRSMIASNHAGGTYTHTDEDINEEINVNINQAIGGYQGIYTGTYGTWKFTADVPNEVKVKPMNPQARYYHETKHTVTTN